MNTEEDLVEELKKLTEKMAERFSELEGKIISLEYALDDLKDIFTTTEE